MINNMRNKEQIYDEEIHPLLSKIIQICVDNDIALLVDLAIPNDTDPSLRCTTALLRDHAPSDMKLAAMLLRPQEVVKAYGIPEHSKPA